MQAAWSAGKGWAVTAAASGLVRCFQGTRGTLVTPDRLVFPIAQLLGVGIGERRAGLAKQLVLWDMPLCRHAWEGRTHKGRAPIGRGRSSGRTTARCGQSAGPSCPCPSRCWPARCSGRRRFGT